MPAGRDASVDLDAYDDDDELAHLSVDMVSYVHPETGEFDITYEGRWSYADGVEPVNEVEFEAPDA